MTNIKIKTLQFMSNDVQSYESKWDFKSKHRFNSNIFVVCCASSILYHDKKLISYDKELTANKKCLIPWLLINMLNNIIIHVSIFMYQYISYTCKTGLTLFFNRNCLLHSMLAVHWIFTNP